VRLHDVACFPASTFLDTMPVAPQLRLSTAEPRSSALCFRFGLTVMPSEEVGLRCFCLRYFQPGITSHEMACRSLGGPNTVRQVILARI
jgi:hypothetical protein